VSEPILFRAKIILKKRAGNSLLISSWRLFGAGLQTPPSAGPQVSRRGRGWRPSVGEVARSGDLATTWSGTARTPGNYFRPVPKRLIPRDLQRSSSGRQPRPGRSQKTPTAGINGWASLARLRTDRWSAFHGRVTGPAPPALLVSPGRLSGLVSIDKPADIVLGAEPVVEITPVRMALFLPDVIGGHGNLSLQSLPLRRLPRIFRFRWGLILVQTHRGGSLGSSSCSLIHNKGMAQFVEHSFSGPAISARPILKKRRAAHLPRQGCGPHGLRTEPPLTSGSNFKIYL